jgi:hypothetical protein
MSKKDEKNLIKKVVLDIDGKEIELSVEQAKKLKGALDDMFGVKEVHHDHYPNWPWYWDYDYFRPRYPGWSDTTVWGNSLVTVTDNRGNTTLPVLCSTDGVQCKFSDNTLVMSL